MKATLEVSESTLHKPSKRAVYVFCFVSESSLSARNVQGRSASEVQGHTCLKERATVPTLR